MKDQLRRVDPGEKLGAFARALSRMAETRPSKFVSRHLAWRLDPILLRVSRGRIASTLVFPTHVLETKGAVSGKQRRNAIIYFHDGDRVIIAASNAGSQRDPDWYHNLRAHPHVTFGGVPMLASTIDDESERQRLWAAADQVFPAYISYRRQAAEFSRSVPLIALARQNTAATFSE